MSGLDFTELLATSKLGEIERPKPLPQGSYVALIKKSEFDKSAKKQTPFVRFHMELLSELEDVSEDDLLEYGNIAGKAVKTELYITEDALFQLQDFLLNHIGLDLEGKSLQEAIPEATNQQVGVRIKQAISEKSNLPYSFVDGTFNPEDE